MSFLEGRKTYIGLIAAFVLTALGIFDVLDPTSDLYLFIGAVIFTFTGISYRNAIKNPPTE